MSVFGEEMHIYGREVSTGHNHLAYFLGTNIAQLPKIFVVGLHFAFIFHIINQCLTPFRSFFTVYVFLTKISFKIVSKERSSSQQC